MNRFHKTVLVTALLLLEGIFSVEGFHTLKKLLNSLEEKLVNKLDLDPDTGLNWYEFIENHGYYYENHTVRTEDGYILNTVRIPCSKNVTQNKSCVDNTKPVVLLLHGIWSNPVDLILNGDTSIGFLLVESGFDVFLMASRGNTYSTGHVNVSTDSKEYWDFSWHEVGVYDIPANMDLIRNVTKNNNVSFIGHSQGGTAFVVLAATRSDYAKRITVAHLFAPVVYMEHTRLPIRFLIEGVDVLEEIVNDLNLNSQGVLTYSPIIELLAILFCSKNSPTAELCRQLFGLAGPDPDQLNITKITVMGSNDPAGGSFKQVLHYFQVTKHNKFRLYDYQREGNLKKYNQPEPPDYNLKSITMPIVLWYGANDYFSGCKDYKRLGKEIPTAIPKPVKNLLWNHIDFAFAIEAKKYVYDEVIKDMKERVAKRSL